MVLAVVLRGSGENRHPRPYGRRNLASPTYGSPTGRGQTKREGAPGGSINRAGPGEKSAIAHRVGMRRRCNRIFFHNVT